MKVLTKYQAADGTLFDHRDDAEDRDRLCDRVAELQRVLAPHPDDSHQRVHQPHVEAYRTALVLLCRELFPREPVFQHEPSEIHPMSYAGRFLSEAAPAVVNTAWFRLMCTDLATGFEYEQPFFALNTDKWQAENKAAGRHA